MPKFEISAPVTAAQSDILSKDALDFLVHLSSAFEPRRQELLARRVHANLKSTPASFPIFFPKPSPFAKPSGPSRPSPPIFRTAASRSPVPWTARWSSTPSTPAPTFSWRISRTPTRPPGRTIIDGQINLRDAVHRDHRLHEPGRQEVQAEREDRDPAGPPARLAPQRKACAGRRRSRSPARSSISACIFFHNAQDADRKGHRPVFLSAEAGEPSRSPPVERRFQSSPRTRWASRAEPSARRC